MNDLLKSLLYTLLFVIIAGITALIVIGILHLCKVYPSIMGIVGICIVVLFILLVIFSIIYMIVTDSWY